MKNCLLTGVGGQGTVLASKLISQTAMDNGQKVTTAETIGMAQRGGSVVSHVRIGDDINSPLIPQGTADVIIAFEPSEAVRVLPYLKKGGFLITSDRAVQPVTASLTGKGYDVNIMLDFLKENVDSLFIVSAEEVEEECGTLKALNVALIGAAVHTGSLGIDIETVKQTMEKIIPARFMEMNMKALMLSSK